MVSGGCSQQIHALGRLGCCRCWMLSSCRNIFYSSLFYFIFSCTGSVLWCPGFSGAACSLSTCGMWVILNTSMLYMLKISRKMVSVETQVLGPGVLGDLVSRPSHASHQLCDVRPSGPHQLNLRCPSTLQSVALFPVINSWARAEHGPRAGPSWTNRSLAVHLPVPPSLLLFVPLLDSHLIPEPSVCCHWLSFCCSDLSWASRGTRVSGLKMNRGRPLPFNTAATFPPEGPQTWARREGTVPHGLKIPA